MQEIASNVVNGLPSAKRANGRLTAERMGGRTPYRERHFSRSRGRKRRLIWFAGRKIRSYAPIRASGLWGRPGSGRMDVPFELVKLVTEGGGDQVVSVDRLTGVL
jgi:hypothetical protein